MSVQILRLKGLSELLLPSSDFIFFQRMSVEAPVTRSKDLRHEGDKPVGCPAASTVRGLVWVVTALVLRMDEQDRQGIGK